MFAHIHTQELYILEQIRLELEHVYISAYATYKMYPPHEITDSTQPYLLVYFVFTILWFTIINDNRRARVYRRPPHPI